MLERSALRVGEGAAHRRGYCLELKRGPLSASGGAGPFQDRSRPRPGDGAYRGRDLLLIERTRVGLRAARPSMNASAATKSQRPRVCNTRRQRRTCRVQRWTVPNGHNRNHLVVVVIAQTSQQRRTSPVARCALPGLRSNPGDGIVAATVTTCPSGR